MLEAAFKVSATEMRLVFDDRAAFTLTCDASECIEDFANWFMSDSPHDFATFVLATASSAEETQTINLEDVKCA